MKLYSILLTSIILFSCNEKQNTTITETPKALQNNKIEIKSYSRSYSDLVEELYKELLENNTELKKLEDAIENSNSKSISLENNFNEFNNKSVNYYKSAHSHTTMIKDSLLRTKITAVINKSTLNYDSKTYDLKYLLKEISEKKSAIQDYQTALKIILTLPVIEKYQKENILNQNEFKTFINTQKSILKEEEKLLK